MTKRIFRVQRRYDEIICAEDEGDISRVWYDNGDDIGFQDETVTEIKKIKDLPPDFDPGSCPWGGPGEMTVAEILKELDVEAWERRKAVHVITDADVGEDQGLFTCLGRVQEQDVGKVIYRVDGIYQVENDEQRRARRANITDREMAKSILMEKLLAKQAEVNALMQEIAGL